MKPLKPEESLQITIVDFVRRFCSGVMIFASMNGAYLGGSKNVHAYISKLKKMGLTVGEPDLRLQWGHRNTLFIECKAGYNNPTQAQADVMADLTQMGFPCEVVYTMDEAIAAFRLHGVPTLPYTMLGSKFTTART